MSGRRALVTGAGGFVGANLVRRLLRDGHAVTALMGPTTDPWRLEEVRDDVALRACDLRDADAVHKLADGADWVFHLAAHGAYSSQDDASRIFATNVLGTVNLVHATAAAEAFVHAGSSSEYGAKDHPPTEREPLEPNSHYAVAKAAATLWLRQLPRGVTLRLYSAYGPWEEPSRLIPRLLAHALRGRLPPLVSPETARDFVYVDDVCEAFVLATGAPPGSIFNIASGRQTTIRDLVNMTRERFDVAARPEWGSMPQRAWDAAIWVGDPSAAQAQLGWAAETPLETGLDEMSRWLRSAAGGTRYSEA